MQVRRKLEDKLGLPSVVSESSEETEVKVIPPDKNKDLRKPPPKSNVVISTTAEPSPPSVVPEISKPVPISNTDNLLSEEGVLDNVLSEVDFETKNEMDDVLLRGKQVLEIMVGVLEENPSPRMAEAVSQLIALQGAMASKSIDVRKTIAETRLIEARTKEMVQKVNANSKGVSLKGSKSGGDKNVQNNVLFAGSLNEALDMASKKK